jgi:phosphatidylserine/phosphatidylglycerophosphate/cardiolipin synthase-like enzyme
VVKESRTAEAVLEAFDTGAFPELVGRNCTRVPYTPLPAVPPFQVSGEMIAYASPDSTYSVTRTLIEGAQRKILIGIYDLTADYMRVMLEAAIDRGVEVSLMLDLDGRTGETPIFDALKAAGAECVPAPSCASKHAKVFASSHEKVIVIDDEWSLIQSGNWSDNSIPANLVDGGAVATWVTGNRDMGLAVRSKPLAAFFTSVLRSDIDLELNSAGPETVGLEAEEAIFAAEAAPPKPPLERFKSKHFNPENAVPVRPVLTPDNYMDIVPGLLRSARSSICIEQQYIRPTQVDIGLLLDAIDEARTAAGNALKVRIVLAPPFPGARFEKEAAAIRSLSTRGLNLGTQVRILNPKYLVHCHNKLIIVDNERVLVSSQNWSDSAVSTNREAGLLVRYPELARYYRKIFDLDWRTGLDKVVKHPTTVHGPEALGQPGMVNLNWGDYAEV